MIRKCNKLSKIIFGRIWIEDGIMHRSGCSLVHILGNNKEIRFITFSHLLIHHHPRGIRNILFILQEEPLIDNLINIYKDKFQIIPLYPVLLIKMFQQRLNFSFLTIWDLRLPLSHPIYNNSLWKRVLVTLIVLNSIIH